MYIYIDYYYYIKKESERVPSARVIAHAILTCLLSKRRALESASNVRADALKPFQSLERMLWAKGSSTTTRADALGLRILSNRTNGRFGLRNPCQPREADVLD